MCSSKPPIGLDGRVVRGARCSGVDYLIAACAIRNSLTVLHRDRDYDALAEIASLDSRSL